MDLNQFVQDFATMFLQSFLVVAVPPLAYMVYQFIKSQLKLVRSRLSSEQLFLLEAIGSIAIKSAEQAGINKFIEDTAYEKKKYAVKAMQDLLRSRGLEILADNVSVISDIIEAGIRDGVQKGQETTFVQALSVPRAIEVTGE